MYYLIYYIMAEGSGVVRDSNWRLRQILPGRLRDQKVSALLGILILDLDKFCPGGCVSSGFARSGVAYSLNKKEKPLILMVAWDKR